MLIMRTRLFHPPNQPRRRSRSLDDGKPTVIKDNVLRQTLKRKASRNASSVTSSSVASSGEMYLTSKCKKQMSFTSEDFGYGSKKNNTNTVSNSSSTSSTEGNNHSNRKRQHHTSLQKPRPKNESNFSPGEKRELRQEKLLRRIKAMRRKMKAIVDHHPSESDMMDLLKEFLIDFVLKSYDNMVKELLICDKQSSSDCLWFLSYFIGFAPVLEVSAADLKHVLSYDTLSYLIFEAVRSFEVFELQSRMRVEITEDFNGLIAAALKEFLYTLESYLELGHISKDEQDFVERLFNGVSLVVVC